MIPESSVVSFSSELRKNLEAWVDPSLVRWVEIAAGAFEAQLTSAGGASHRHIAAPIARWMGMQRDEWRGLGVALDLLQVAFDLADNLADVEEDERLGRGYQAMYAGIPGAVRMALPAYLVATSREQLDRTFGHRTEALRDASRLLHDVLGAMVIGQGIDEPLAKARCVSGAQAKLLCLPVCLRGPHVSIDEALRHDLLTWAEAWGTTWELRFAYVEAPAAVSRALWVRSVDRARSCWPCVGPFASGGPLAVEAQLPGGLC